jgi:hypothetical protein
VAWHSRLPPVGPAAVTHNLVVLAGMSWCPEYVDAGFDEVYVSQIGDDQAGFFKFYRRELAPRLS